ncbi:non-ribosomal peptide synthetase [Gordonia aurantiaca]|uniref:non-ribosomal peptide synthetase n=1 Tax=Gordonia sp. B21 TaxID=3151852 RepID=UPI003266EB57
MTETPTREIPADETPGSMSARWRTVAAARGDAIALRTPEEDISYADAAVRVEERARRIAAMTAPGQPVAVEVESDIDSVITMLAVWCSGRPLVVLDPLLPAERRTALLGRSGAKCYTADEEHRVTPVAELPEPAPTDPAILLFTSGSTGVPKGVVLPHDLFTNNTRDGRRFMGFGPDDRVAVLLPLTFGGGMDTLTMSLFNGATLLLWDVRRRTTADLREWLDTQGVTTAHCTPSLLRAWLTDLGPDDAIDTLRLLSACGEPSHRDDIRRMRETIGPRATFCCWAGASEIGNLAFNLFPPDVEIPEGAIPVGTPAKTVRIVDENGADVPAGSTGEVVVESAYVATGYHENPEMTAARFETLPDGRRRYRSGDLGRFDDNGRLTLIGRGDDAVKIRGYLVEPLEVESAIRSLPWTTDAAVTANREESRLTAHVAVDPNKWQPSPAEIRQELAKTLAPWMIPRDIVVVASIPRNERGKVDRAALPPTPPRPEPEPPRGFTEMALHHYWCEILGLEPQAVGRHDDFVELGGDSLAASKMITEVRHHLQLDLTTAMLAEAPTIAEFAQRIEAAAKERSKNATGATLIRLRKGTGTPIFLICGAGSLASSLTQVVRSLSTGRPVYVIQSRGIEKRALADHSIRAMARRAISDIRSVQPHGPYQLAGYSLGGFVAVEVAARLSRAGETCDTVAVLDSSIDPVLAQRLSGNGPGPVERVRSALKSLTAPGGMLPDRTGSDEEKPTGPPLQNAVQELAINALMLTAGLVSLPTPVQWLVFFRLGTRMIRRHRPTPYSGPITVLRTRSNPDDPAMWRYFTTGKIEIVEIEGEHISMIRPPFAATTAKALDRVIERESASPSRRMG